MPRELLPTHQWYACDACGQPRLQARLAPKAVADRTARCHMTPKCAGRMTGPVDNPTGRPEWGAENFIPRKCESCKSPDPRMKPVGEHCDNEFHAPWNGVARAS